ncbi:MAG: hypothetical protein Q7R57_02900 [Dehalococcoidales bacterium]|nr:hypothetical protein [Dehalococcoidales bacterium]
MSNVKEKVIKEYPTSTRWLEGRKILGVGNLILTNKRLIFLNQVALSDMQMEALKKISEGGDLDKITDYALDLHKSNFDVPLTSVNSARVGLYTLLPFPRPCLRVFWENPKKKGQIKSASFMFTIPLLRGLFQFEIMDVFAWVSRINTAVKQAKWVYR